MVDLRMPGPSGLELVKRRPGAPTGIANRGLNRLRQYRHRHRGDPAGGGKLPAQTGRCRGNPGRLQPSTAGDARRTTDDIATPSLARAEWEHINRVLTDCGGNISEAAKRLKLHRRTLQRKLNKFPPLD